MSNLFLREKVSFQKLFKDKEAFDKVIVKEAFAKKPGRELSGGIGIILLCFDFVCVIGNFPWISLNKSEIYIILLYSSVWLAKRGQIHHLDHSIQNRSPVTPLATPGVVILKSIVYWK